MKIPYFPRSCSLTQTSPAVVTKFLLAVFLTCASVATPAAAIAQITTTTTTTVNAQPPATGDERRDAAAARSTVRGRVVYEDTGRPLRRARVTLADPAGNGRDRYRMAWTDARGNFTVKNVASGKYYVAVEAPGIVTTAYSNLEEVQRELPSVAVDGKSSAEIKIQARRGGAVSGKVSYADGDPVVGANVIVLRKKDGKLTPVYTGGMRGADGARTDDRGMYRLAGLPSGEYIVGVAEQMLHANEPEDDDGTVRFDHATLAPTYYSEATTTRNATPLKINAGEETKDIDITLVEQSTHKLAGTVVARRDGRPVARARLNLVSKDRDEALTNRSWGERTANTDAEGRWTFEEVTDGSYTIMVMPESAEDYSGTRGAGAPERVVQRFVFKRQDVTLAGTDVTGLTIEVSGGGSITGTVVVEGGKPLPPNVNVFPESAYGERRIVFSEAPSVTRDGKFKLEGISEGGVYLLAVVQPENKYYTKSVTVNGIDIMRGTPLEVVDGAEVKGVRIVISPDVATLTGRVLAESNRAPLREAGLVLVPAEAERQQIRGARLYGFTNAEGRFHVSGAPGEYLVVVTRTGENAYALGDETLRARLATAQRVALQPNERKSLDIVAPSVK